MIDQATGPRTPATGRGGGGRGRGRPAAPRVTQPAKSPAIEEPIDFTDTDFPSLEKQLEVLPTTSFWKRRGA